MSKQCLDVQQMQHLQKLGLDTSNASLCYYKQEGWEANYFIALACDIKKKEGLTYYYDSFGNKEYILNEVIPAYTLQDVLDALPDFIDEYSLIIDIAFGVIRYDNLKWKDSPILKETYFNDEDNYLIDAAYEMLVWCVENKLIETNKNE